MEASINIQGLPILSSTANEIKIQLTNFSPKLGVFMKNTYEGVSHELSSDQLSIILAG